MFVTPSIRSGHVRHFFIQQEHIQVVQISKSYSKWTFFYFVIYGPQGTVSIKVLKHFSPVFFYKENSMVKRIKFLSQS